jgi:hypothetical protein
MWQCFKFMVGVGAYFEMGMAILDTERYDISIGGLNLLEAPVTRIDLSFISFLYHSN